MYYKKKEIAKTKKINIHNRPIITQIFEMIGLILPSLIIFASVTATNYALNDITLRPVQFSSSRSQKRFAPWGLDFFDYFE